MTKIKLLHYSLLNVMIFLVASAMQAQDEDRYKPIQQRKVEYDQTWNRRDYIKWVIDKYKLDTPPVVAFDGKEITLDEFYEQDLSAVTCEQLYVGKEAMEYFQRPCVVYFSTKLTKDPVSIYPFLYTYPDSTGLTPQQIQELYLSTTHYAENDETLESKTEFIGEEGSLDNFIKSHLKLPVDFDPKLDVVVHVRLLVDSTGVVVRTIIDKVRFRQPQLVDVIFQYGKDFQVSDMFDIKYYQQLSLIKMATFDLTKQIPRFKPGRLFLRNVATIIPLEINMYGNESWKYEAEQRLKELKMASKTK